jgi:hypothetical protein
MLFASTSLAARIERAECRLVADATTAAARRHPDADVFAMPLAGGVATFTAAGSPLNKVVGLEVAGERAAPRVRAALRAGDPGPRGMRCR